MRKYKQENKDKIKEGKEDYSPRLGRCGSAAGHHGGRDPGGSRRCQGQRDVLYQRRPGVPDLHRRFRLLHPHVYRAGKAGLIEKRRSPKQAGTCVFSAYVCARRGNFTRPA